MSRKQNKKIMSGLAGATLLLSGCAAAAPVQAPPVAPGTEQEAPKTAAGLELNGYQLEALAAAFFTEAFQKRLRQQKNILTALTQGRQMHGNNVETII